MAESVTAIEPLDLLLEQMICSVTKSLWVAFSHLFFEPVNEIVRGVAIPF